MVLAIDIRSSESSTSTHRNSGIVDNIRKRSSSLANVRSTLSAGDDTTQLVHELRSSSREDRGRLMEEIRQMVGKFLYRVSVKNSVAMKADLNLPWNKLRTMRRYT